MSDDQISRAPRRQDRWALRAATASAAALLGFGITTSLPLPSVSPALSQPASRALPAPPPGGTMGFVVDNFVSPVIQGNDACPHGLVPTYREMFLATLAPEEAARLRLKENEAEFTERWQASAFNSDGSNVCSQPDRFQRQPFNSVESKYAWGLNLDGKGSGQSDGQGCAQENFQTPTGEIGIDNGAYRALGCTRVYRGVDGIAGDIIKGVQQFHNSGEWTQVILLKGVDSLVDDPEVEVIYGNTADRPVVDGKGKFLADMSYTISTRLPRHRNQLRGRIVKGVLTTDPADITLTQTWGQGGARDIRGNRVAYQFLRGRLRLEFQPDGTLRGMVGGYQPLFNLIASSSVGGAGAALNAGLDCGAAMATLRKYADGMRDPKTGKCTAISDAMRISAVPAFVNDAPPAPRSAAR